MPDDSPIGFCSSPRFAEHRTGPHHPERPDRIRAVWRAIVEAGMLDAPDPWPEFHIDLGSKARQAVRLTNLGEPLPAPDAALLTVHTREHVDRVRHVCAAGGGVLDSGDTPVGPNSCEIALLATGAVLRCCDAVAGGEV